MRLPSCRVHESESELALAPSSRNQSRSFSRHQASPELKSRAQQIADLKRSANVSTSPANAAPGDATDPYDLLVIGGGATGAGVALDAATRGLRVAVVERDDFGSGTSSKSAKLVRGGVRYLKKAVWKLDYNQHKLVREALRERSYFLETAPHLSQWIPIMIPVDKW